MTVISFISLGQSGKGSRSKNGQEKLCRKMGQQRNMAREKKVERGKAGVNKKARVFKRA
jgi:hypothetical protein